MNFPGNYSLTLPTGVATGGLDTVAALIIAVINLGLIAIIVISFLMLIWGGVRWITSSGEKQGLAGAKSTITYALIAMILGFCVFLILRVISGLFQFDLGAGTSSYTPAQVDNTIGGNRER